MSTITLDAPTDPWLAVRPAGDRVAHARALQRIQEEFHAGADVADRVRAVIAQSWARSEGAGVDPACHLPRILMDDREVEARWSRHPLQPIVPMLRELLSSATSESVHMLVITDAHGVLMWIEGHHRVIEATQDIHLIRGADWSETGAGTNAMGTAIAVDHPVQIFSAEHFNRIVHRWQCSGAPIHDPTTGEIIGVVNLTGHLRTAHPHTLALVTASAGIAEGALRHDRARRDATLREAYLERVAGSTQATALFRPSGQLVMAMPHGWAPAVVEGLPADGVGQVVLPGIGVADVEPLGGLDGLVLWRRPSARIAAKAAEPPTARLELLGRRPRLVLPSGPIELSGRHAEILTVLLLAGRELTSEQLTLEVYGEEGKPVTLRAEMSRLRRVLGSMLTTRPYGLAFPVRSDLQDAEELLGRGHIAEALRLAQDGVLPGSDAPRVVEARERLEYGLRTAILRSGDRDLLCAWCRSAFGQDDEPAARAMVDLLDPLDPHLPAARAHLARIERCFDF